MNAKEYIPVPIPLEETEQITFKHQQSLMQIQGRLILTYCDKVDELRATINMLWELLQRPASITIGEHEKAEQAVKRANA
jgi:hypothetical protein